MNYGCDTSFLMRILTNHPNPLAADVISEAFIRVKRGDVFEVSDLVLSEAYFALQVSYGLTKSDALKCLKAISFAKGFKVSDYAKEILTLPGLDKASPGFVDRLIHGGYFVKRRKTVSCEKSFSKLANTEVFKERRRRVVGKFGIIRA